MTTPSIPNDMQANDWQTKYQADQAHDADGKRMDIMFLMYVIAILISSIYATAYVWFHYGQKLVERGGILTGWLLITVMLTLTVVAAFFLLYRAAIHFFTCLYQQEEGDPKARLALRFFGVPPVPPPLRVIDALSYPFVMIKDGKVDPKKDWVIWLGGPARLLIFDGNAVYVERASSFSRILGPASRFPFLDATETVKAVIDLHPQVLTKPDGVRAWTKDGIEIKMDVRLEFQIGMEGMTEATSNGLLFPFGPISVKKAHESIVVRYDQERKCLTEAQWPDRVWGYIQGILATYIFSHTLDELFLAERGPDQLLAPNVTANWRREMNVDLEKIGARLLSLQITNVMPINPDVNVQRVKSWEARKQSAVTISGGKAKAYEILAHEKARAEAERDLIDAIVEGLRTHPTSYSEQLILSLSGILNQSLKDSDYGIYIPGETLESFNKLRDLLHL